jgi:carbamoyl-phosphate synthase large subunit
MGGQTALNCALDLADNGVLEKYNVELIGAKREAIDKAEDREKFKRRHDQDRPGMPDRRRRPHLDEALEIQTRVGFPTIIRPSFTLGGSGGGIAYNREELRRDRQPRPGSCRRPPKC